MKRNEMLAYKGCSLEQLAKAFFNDADMKFIGSDHHKNSDGDLEVCYCWYFDNPIQGDWAWEVYHPGYVRGTIRGKGRTLQEAIDDFIDCWSEWNEEFEFE